MRLHECGQMKTQIIQLPFSLKALSDLDDYKDQSLLVRSSLGMIFVHVATTTSFLGEKLRTYKTHLQSHYANLKSKRKEKIPVQKYTSSFIIT